MNPANSLFQTFLSHKDYASVQADGAKHPLWQPMSQFKSVRAA